MTIGGTVERTHRQDENVTELDIMAGQGSINFSEHTIVGMPGTIADVLHAHNLNPSDMYEGAEGGKWHEVDTLIDRAPEAVHILVQIFPRLERVTVHRRLSSRDGGGSYAWKSFRPEWQPAKNMWKFHITQHT